MWCYTEKREQFGLSRAIFWDLPSNNSLTYSPRWLRMCVCTCICFCVKCSVAHVSGMPFKNHVYTFWSFSSAVSFNCPSANMKGRNNFFSIQQFGTYTCDCLTSQHCLTKLCERREGGLFSKKNGHFLNRPNQKSYIYIYQVYILITISIK